MQATGINDAGQIVGTFNYCCPGGFNYGQGFLDSQGSVSSIDVPGATNTDANAINNAGQIVGSFSDSSGAGHAFLDSGGRFTQIDVPGATRTAAWGINDAGHPCRN
jgi:probable HAF family extracellular repeat protein